MYVHLQIKYFLNYVRMNLKIESPLTKKFTRQRVCLSPATIPNATPTDYWLV